MKKTTSQIIVDFMRFLGIRYCFGIPGSNMELLHEIEKNKRISMILTKHESNAAFMASGFTKASGIISACFGSVGPGATNLVTGVAAAYEDSQPILVLTGQVPKAFHGCNVFQESTGIGRTINQKGMFANITKYTGYVYDEKDLLTQLKKIYTAIKIKRPGPCYLEIGTDIMEEKVNMPHDFFNCLKKLLKDKNNVDERRLAYVADLMLNAEKPLILAGGGAIYSNVGALITEIAEALTCPIATTLKGKGIVSEDHPLSLGCVGLTGQNCANEYIKSVDVLLAIGVSFHQFTTVNWSLLSKKTKII